MLDDAAQIEAARRAVVRYCKRRGKLWCVFSRTSL